VSKDEIGNVLKYNEMDNLNLFLTENLKLVWVEEVMGVFLMIIVVGYH